MNTKLAANKYGRNPLKLYLIWLQEIIKIEAGAELNPEASEDIMDKH